MDRKQSGIAARSFRVSSDLLTSDHAEEAAVKVHVTRRGTDRAYKGIGQGGECG